MVYLPVSAGVRPPLLYLPFWTSTYSPGEEALCVWGGVQEGMPGEGGGWKDKARLATVPASYIHSLPRQLLPDT